MNILESISGKYYDWTLTKKPEKPYRHNYSKTLTMKLFLSKPDNNGGSLIGCTFEEALELIKQLDIVTRKIPKIVYLVGWQYKGHDDKYPAWFEVNEDLKRPQDKTALDSLKWLMNEAFKYDTIVSLHINMTDAYKDSPLWDEYVKNDLISKKEDGTFLETGVWGGKTAYQICYKHEWEKGFAIKRIEKLLEMLPIEKAGTIHIDAFFCRESKGHNISLETEQYYRRKIFRYWRKKGIDVTSEFIYRETGYEDLIGIMPLAWHINQKQINYLERPANLICGGSINTDLEGEYGDENIGFLFGKSLYGEDCFTSSQVGGINSNWFDKFIQQFCLQTLPWYLLNCHIRIKVEGKANDRIAYYNDDLIVQLNHKIIKKQGNILRQNNDVLFPVLWSKQKEIIAYSKDGYENKVWCLPRTWDDIENVDLYTISPKGLSYLKKININDNNIKLTLKPNQAVSIVESKN